MRCPVCHGSGISPGTFGTSFAIHCGACHGSGRRRSPRHDGFDSSPSDDFEPEDDEGDARAGPDTGRTSPTTAGSFRSFALPDLLTGDDLLRQLWAGPDADGDPGATSTPEPEPEAPSTEASTSPRTGRGDPPSWASPLTSGLFSASSSYDRFASLFGPTPDPSAPAMSAADDWEDLSDVELLMKLLEVDRRYMAQLHNTMVGRATASTATALTAIRADYRRFTDLSRDLPTVSRADLQRKIAETGQALARVHESLDELDAAEREYVAAREIYVAVDDSREVDAIDRRLRELRRHRDGDVDGALDDLRTRLQSTVAPLARAGLLVELGELHSSVNDDFEALALFEEAESLLEPHRREATGGATADALASTLGAIMGGRPGGGETALERSLRIRALLRRVYQGLVQLLREDDPARAADYLTRLDEMEGSLAEGGRDTADFTARMTQALEGLFGPSWSTDDDTPGG